MQAGIPMGMKGASERKLQWAWRGMYRPELQWVWIAVGTNGVSWWELQLAPMWHPDMNCDRQQCVSGYELRRALTGHSGGNCNSNQPGIQTWITRGGNRGELLGRQWGMQWAPMGHSHRECNWGQCGIWAWIPSGANGIYGRESQRAPTQHMGTNSCGCQWEIQASIPISTNATYKHGCQ